MLEMAMPNLSVLAYAQGFTQWHYRAPHKFSDVLLDGYFKPAAGMIETGDMIHVSAHAAGGILFVRHSTGSKHDKTHGPLDVSITVELMVATAAAGGML